MKPKLGQKTEGYTYNGCFDKPTRIAYRVEESECLLHAVLGEKCKEIGRGGRRRLVDNSDIPRSHLRITSDHIR